MIVIQVALTLLLALPPPLLLLKPTQKPTPLLRRAWLMLSQLRPQLRKDWLMRPRQMPEPTVPKRAPALV